MTYKELQRYLKEKYGDNVSIKDDNTTYLYSLVAGDSEIRKYIGNMNSILTDDEVLYNRIINEKELDNLNIYKVDKLYSDDDNLDAIYDNGLLWVNYYNDGNKEEYSMMINNYKFEHRECRVGK